MRHGPSTRIAQKPDRSPLNLCRLKLRKRDRSSNRRATLRADKRRRASPSSKPENLDLPDSMNCRVATPLDRAYHTRSIIWHAEDRNAGPARLPPPARRITRLSPFMRARLQPDSPKRRLRTTPSTVPPAEAARRRRGDGDRAGQNVADIAVDIHLGEAIADDAQDRHARERRRHPRLALPHRLAEEDGTCVRPASSATPGVAGKNRRRPSSLRRGHSRRGRARLREFAASKSSSPAERLRDERRRQLAFRWITSPNFKAAIDFATEMVFVPYNPPGCRRAKAMDRLFFSGSSALSSSSWRRSDSSSRSDTAGELGSWSVRSRG